MAQPVTVGRQCVLLEEDDDLAAGLLHRPVPAARTGRLGDLDDPRERELAHDVPGAVG